MVGAFLCSRRKSLSMNPRGWGVLMVFCHRFQSALWLETFVMSWSLKEIRASGLELLIFGLISNPWAVDIKLVVCLISLEAVVKFLIVVCAICNIQNNQSSVEAPFLYLMADESTLIFTISLNYGPNSSQQGTLDDALDFGFIQSQPVFVSCARMVCNVIHRQFSQ